MQPIARNLIQVHEFGVQFGFDNNFPLVRQFPNAVVGGGAPRPALVAAVLHFESESLANLVDDVLQHQAVFGGADGGGIYAFARIGADFGQLDMRQQVAEFPRGRVAVPQFAVSGKRDDLGEGFSLQFAFFVQVNQRHGGCSKT